MVFVLRSPPLAIGIQFKDSVKTMTSSFLKPSGPLRTGLPLLPGLPLSVHRDVRRPRCRHLGGGPLGAIHL